MKINNIKNKRIIIILKKICEYIINHVWNSHILGNDEISLQFELAKEKSKRYKEDIVQLSKIDLDLDWSEEKKIIDKKRFIVYKKGDFNPWYKGNLEIEELISSLRPLYEFKYESDYDLIDAEFINNFESLESIIINKKKREIKNKINERSEKTSVSNVKIIEIPKLKIEGFEKIINKKEIKKLSKFPYKLPAGTKWQDITIKFLDDENVLIKVKHFNHKTNYKEMEFIGKGKNPPPSEAWVFLKVLAQVNGELTIRDPRARKKYKKQKELLAKSLQNYFSLDYDPFYPYYSSSEKIGNSYKIKINLIPPTRKKEDISINKNDKINNDIEIMEYFNEQTTSIYEDK